jgi:hypothetical protein
VTPRLLAAVLALGSLAQTPHGADAKAPNLQTLAQHTFGKLSHADAKLFDSVARGMRADFTNDRLNTIPSSRIAWLCSDPRARLLVPPRGIRIRAYPTSDSTLDPVRAS